MQTDTVSKEIKEKVKEIEYKVDAIAHHITDKVPTAHRNDTVLNVKGVLLESAKDYDTINYIYVLSKSKRLKGVVSIKELLNADSNQKISEVMQQENLVVAHPHTDQEKVAHTALRHNLKAMPVVDKKNKFIGVVPSDQVLSILDQESEEDLLKFAGYILGSDHPEEESKQPVITSFVHRIPWIIVGLLGGTVTARLISSFSGVLSQNLILASFIPLVAYIASAVSNQTQTVLIRDMATRANIKIYDYFLKQLMISVLIGLSSWLIIFLLSTVLWVQPYTGVIIGFAVFLAVSFSTLLAISIPYSLKKFRMDPVVGSGPFTTVIQDFISIMIYFSVASALI